MKLYGSSLTCEGADNLQLELVKISSTMGKFYWSAVFRERRVELKAVSQMTN